MGWLTSSLKDAGGTVGGWFGAESAGRDVGAQAAGRVNAAFGNVPPPAPPAPAPEPKRDLTPLAAVGALGLAVGLAVSAMSKR